MGKRTSRRTFLGTLGLASVATLLAACGGPAPGSVAPAAPTAAGTTNPASPPTAPPQAPPTTAPAAPSRTTTTVTFGAGDDATLNPLLVMFASSVDLLFESLVKPDPKLGTPIPSLAQSWDSTPDGLTWTFHIRPDVKWSDGQAFTANDATFTFETALDPKTRTPFRSRFDNVASFDAPDPATFRVQLKRADCPFLSITMQTPIVPRHVLAGSADINADEFNSSRPVGTGPFTLKEWRRGEYTLMLANPTYWQGRPRIDQWIRTTVTDRNVLLAKLKLGEVDYASVPPDSFDELKAEPNLNVVAVQSPVIITYLAYNLENALFQDKRVRQALTHALDREAIVRSQLAGQGNVLESSLSPVSWAHSSNVPTFAFDAERARTLLRDAGWTPGQDGILQKDGTRFAFTLLTNSGNPQRAAIVVIAQDSWKKVGVEVQTQILETNAFNTRWQTPGKREFDAIVAGGGAGVTIDPDQSNLWLSSEYPNGGNFVHYSNPTVDQLLQQARGIPGCDPAARKPLYEQFQQLLADDQPFTFLYSANTIAAINKRLQNVTPSPWAGSSPYVTWGIKDWTVSG